MRTVKKSREIRTLGVVLQYVHVEVRINDKDVQLTLERQKLGRNDFHLRSRLAEKRELVRLLLRECQ